MLSSVDIIHTHGRLTQGEDVDHKSARLHTYATNVDRLFAHLDEAIGLAVHGPAIGNLKGDRARVPVRINVL